MIRGVVRAVSRQVVMATAVALAAFGKSLAVDWKGKSLSQVIC